MRKEVVTGAGVGEKMSNSSGFINHKFKKFEGNCQMVKEKQGNYVSHHCNSGQGVSTVSLKQSFMPALKGVLTGGMF